MAVRALLSEQEYLRTSFEGLDREYRDGEVVERALPDFAHASTQSELSFFFRRLRSDRNLPCYPASELRNRLHSGRYMIPDICVFWPVKPSSPIPEIKPHVVVEILSPDDPLTEVRQKLREYVEWGIPHVWLIDPRLRLFYVCDENGLHEVPVFTMPEIGVELTPADLFN